MTIPERVCVGAVIGAFGINGEIRIKSFCSDPKSIADYDQLTDETGEKTFNLKSLGGGSSLPNQQFLANLAPSWRPKSLPNRDQNLKKSMLKITTFSASIFQGVGSRFGRVFG